MMRKIIKGVFTVALVLLSLSCGNEKKSVTSESGADISVINTATENPKVEEWVVKGVECYGIVILNRQDGTTTGRVVKSKVMSVRADRVKMKAIESISFNDAVGCDLLGISYGETWWETEGDIFKTKEDAEAYLIKKNWI